MIRAAIWVYTGNVAAMRTARRRRLRAVRKEEKEEISPFMLYHRPFPSIYLTDSLRFPYGISTLLSEKMRSFMLFLILLGTVRCCRAWACPVLACCQARWVRCLA